MRAELIGVNRPELSVRAGTYPWMPPLPFIPGIEMAGTVDQLGDGVEGVAEGQRVFVGARELEHRAGCYAEYIAVPARALALLPDGVASVAAASLASYQMAYHLLLTATRGVFSDSVLVDVASGAIGSAAVQLAKCEGASCVIAVVGSDEKARALRDFGADHAIVRTAGAVAPTARQITSGRGVDLVLNGTGGDSLNEQVGLMAPLGLTVVFAHLGGPLRRDLLDAFDVGGAAFGQSGAIRFMNAHTFDDLPEYRKASMEYLTHRLKAGEIDPLVHDILPLEDARRAHELLEKRQAVGKVFLRPAH